MSYRLKGSSRAGYRWSPTEDKELVDRFVDRVSAASIAAEFGRTERAIRARISRLGLAELPELRALLPTNPPIG